MLKEWQQAVIFLTYKNTLFSISQKYFVKIYYQKNVKGIMKTTVACRVRQETPPFMPELQPNIRMYLQIALYQRFAN